MNSAGIPGRLSALVFAFALVCGLPSCGATFQEAPYDSPLRGLIYTNVHYTSRASAVPDTGGAARPAKKGENCSWSMAYLSYFWFETGGSAQAAAGEAGITKIAVIEKHVTTGMFMGFARECTVVWGE